MTNPTIEGNLLEQKGILGHQVNMFGHMGHGLARQIALKWPEVEQIYQGYTHTLGHCLLIDTHASGLGVWIANLYGQIGIGTNGRKTHYGHLAAALAVLQVKSVMMKQPVFLPWRMSSDLAGGDWEIVSELIAGILPEATIVRLPAYDPRTGKPA